jgi:hypothetical protein
MSLAEELKAKLLSSKNFKVRAVKVKLDGETEETVGVRQVSLFVRQKLVSMAQKADSVEAKAKADAQVVIEAACEPVTGERLFGPADLDTILKEQVGGGWPDDVTRAAVEMMHTPVLDAKCREFKKGADGKPLIEEGKPVLCGGNLTEKYCPRCGCEAPEMIERAKGN